MATSPFLVERFGGLNLIQDPEEAGALNAVALSNVDLDQLGRVRTRPGYSLVGSAASTDVPRIMAFYSYVTSEYLVAATTLGSTVTQYNLSSGSSTSTTTAIVTSNNAFVRWGGVANTSLILADFGTSNIQKLSNSTWTTHAIGNGSEFLTITPNDDRLVAAGTSSNVAFSDPGDPTTFGVNNFVQIHPGDGEEIKAAVTWRDYVFVFKQSKFFVFYGTSTDADGNPIFNYRLAGTGHGVTARGMAVAGDEGVYFADKDGVYLTTGDSQRYISRAIEPWLQAGAYTGLPSFNLGSESPSGYAATSMTYYQRRLYITNNGTTLVYDPQLDSWFVWSLGADGACTVPPGYTASGVVLAIGSSKRLARLTGTTDNGSAISWSYTSGLYDPSGKNCVAVSLESALWGTGTATLQVANDHGAVDTGSVVTLGTSPAVIQGWQQIDREGVFWQHKLSGSGVATINRLAHYVSFVKPSGVQ